MVVYKRHVIPVNRNIENLPSLPQRIITVPSLELIDNKLNTWMKNMGRISSVPLSFWGGQTWHYPLLHWAHQYVDTWIPKFPTKETSWGWFGSASGNSEMAAHKPQHRWHLFQLWFCGLCLGCVKEPQARELAYVLHLVSGCFACCRSNGKLEHVANDSQS